MAVMTHEYSSFPDRVYTPHKFKDVSKAPSSIQLTITNIKTHIANGDYSSAAALLQKSKNDLMPYYIDSEVINMIEEEIRNLEIHSKKQRQFHYTSDLEPDCVAGDVWIGTEV